MADARINVPAECRRSEPFEVRVSIRHAMETGYRTDAVGKTIARNVIVRFECRYNDAAVFAVRMSPGVAANPYLRFYVTARDSGTLDFEWIDDAGVRATAQAAIKVA
jgi:sulfur-oxidizing protein SoxZ